MRNVPLISDARDRPQGQGVGNRCSQASATSLAPHCLSLAGPFVTPVQECPWAWPLALPSVLTAQVSASQTVSCLSIPWGSCEKSDLIKVGPYLRFRVSPELSGDVGAAGPGRTARVARPRRACVVSSCLPTAALCRMPPGPEFRLRHATPPEFQTEMCSRRPKSSVRIATGISDLAF